MEIKTNKEKVKEKLIEIFDVENRPLNIREVTKILKKRFRIIRSEPIIKRYLDELIRDNELKLVN